MQLLESVLLLINFVWLLVQGVSGTIDKYRSILFATGLAALALHALFEIPRWQLIPCYVLFVFLSLLSLKRSQSHALVRLLGVVLGTLMIGSSLYLAAQLPIVELPAPAGPYSVGSTSFTLTDASRRESLSADPEAKRELFVDVWYPGVSRTDQSTPKAETLWEELYAGEWDRVRFVMDYLRGVDTHTYPDLPIDVGHGPYPILLFSHGLQMFTSQSTLLMEHLASNGYVIFSIAHPYESLRVNLVEQGTVMPDFIMSVEKFREAMTWIEEANRHIVAATDSSRWEESPEQRSEIMLQAIESSPELNARVEVWVEDTRFVLDQIQSNENTVPSIRAMLDTNRVGVMGMSIGGAAAGEFCKADVRCTAGVNVDGLQYGSRQRQPLDVPFLMIYSDDGAGVNEFMRLGSRHDYHEYHFMGARHADFTDLAFVWPWMRHAGQLGSIPAERMNHILNTVVLNFLDHYVGGKPLVPLSQDDFPELKMDVLFGPSLPRRP